MRIKPETCELIGAIIGDGNIYYKGNYVEIAGHPVLDEFYYNSFLKPLIISELGYYPKIRERYGAIRLRIDNKEFVLWLIGLGIPAGHGKFAKVVIPKKILVQFPDYSKYTIRGIFDTDGSVYYDKRKIYRKPYIRIEFHMDNRRLLNQISGILHQLKLKPRPCKRKNSLYLNGYDEVKKFIITIGISNIRHINRIRKQYPELIDSPR
ncbi:MAG: hypothetical protein JXC85_04625 [Candidatus Aenigmarchaeota archaeon]|nr:hypothetical protein [Candidatus Aenigmarchaeota archaeon]